jgi:hypothetical protein
MVGFCYTLTSKQSDMLHMIGRALLLAIIASHYPKHKTRYGNTSPHEQKRRNNQSSIQAHHSPSLRIESITNAINCNASHSRTASAKSEL